MLLFVLVALVVSCWFYCVYVDCLVKPDNMLVFVVLLVVLDMKTLFFCYFVEARKIYFVVFYYVLF